MSDENAEHEGEKPAEPKREFGILAARFLQKGKSAPATVTGEFEALKPLEKKPDERPEPSQVSPIDFAGSTGEALDLGLDEATEPEPSIYSTPETENVVEIDLDALEEAPESAPVQYDYGTDYQTSNSSAQSEYDVPEPSAYSQQEEPAVSSNAQDESDGYDPRKITAELPPDAMYPPETVYDKSALDQIGIKHDDSSISPEILDQIKAKSEAPPPPPAKSGLLAKFAPKKDLREDSRMIDLNALHAGQKKVSDAAEQFSSESKPYDPSVLDQIGAKTDSAYDLSALDQIGGKNNAFDPGALDQIGVKKDRVFDPSALDQIGVKPDGGTDLSKIFVEPGTEETEKTAKGGLLGGKFGQKAKVFGGDKPKLGASIPTNDPGLDQKETGMFRLDQSALSKKTDAEVLAESPPQYAAESAEPEPEPEPDVEESRIIPGDEIGRLITDADAAFKLRQYKQAEPIYARALDKLDKIGADADPRLVGCLDKSGDNFFELKKYKEALPIFRRLLILHEKVSSQDRDIISTLYKIAKTSESLNLTGEADSMYKRAFRLGQQSLVPGDPLLAKVLEGYGTMLMRSEGADPSSSDKRPEASKSTTLSAEEIKFLNELNVKADAEHAASSAAPIVLGGGSGVNPSATASRLTAAKAPLRDEEKVEKMRSAVTGESSGNVNIAGRAAFFVLIVAFLLWFIFNPPTFTAVDDNKPGPYSGKVYKTIDGLSVISFSNNKQGTKEVLGERTIYDYKPWNGKLGDDLEVVSGQVGSEDFIYDTADGLKDSKGNVYYESKAPENQIVAKMHEVGTKAQAFYKAHGSYPEGEDLTKLTKIGYKNPFGGNDSLTARSISWPAGLDAKQVFMKSKFDSDLDNGHTWEGEQGGAGVITAAAAQNKKPNASVFYIHGRGRNGELFKRIDGKTLLLAYKNGLDVSPVATSADAKAPKVHVPLRVTKLGAVSALTVILSYVPIIAFLVVAGFFLMQDLRRRSGHTQGPSIAPFGMIWAVAMAALCCAPKIAPEPVGTFALPAAIVVFIVGLGWIGFSLRKYRVATRH